MNAHTSNHVKATALIVAAFAGSAIAQPLHQNAGEPDETREVSNDLTLLSGGEIATVGGIDRPGMGIEGGYVLVYDPSGVPLVSWIVSDFAAATQQDLAAREDPADKNLIVLQDADTSSTTGLTLFKMDPFAGAMSYAWRYNGENHGENLGMELDGQTGLVAASERAPSGDSTPTLLRFDNATGAPVFHARYLTFNNAFNGRFFDVAVNENNGDIYAVGSIQIEDDTSSPLPRILIARLSPSGAPIWFRAYEPFYPTEFIEHFEGVSIEAGLQNSVVITARGCEDPNGVVTMHMSVDATSGAVNMARVVLDARQKRFEPAYSSLERLSDGTMLVSGTTTTADGIETPTMWNFDQFTGSIGWVWSGENTFGIEGLSAIEQPGEGALLAGQVFPSSVVGGPIGGFDDAYLARTNLSGDGLCPQLPVYREIEPQVQVMNIPVEPVQMPFPEQTQLELIHGQPTANEICAADCPPDLDGNGILDFFDLSALLTGMIDYDGNTVFDFFDISAFLADFSAGCP